MGMRMRGKRTCVCTLVSRLTLVYEGGLPGPRGLAAWRWGNACVRVCLHAGARGGPNAEFRQLQLCVTLWRMAPHASPYAFKTAPASAVAIVISSCCHRCTFGHFTVHSFTN